MSGFNSLTTLWRALKLARAIADADLAGAEIIAARRLAEAPRSHPRVDVGPATTHGAWTVR